MSQWGSVERASNKHKPQRAVNESFWTLTECWVTLKDRRGFVCVLVIFNSLYANTSMALWWRNQHDFSSSLLMQSNDLLAKGDHTSSSTNCFSSCSNGCSYRSCFSSNSSSSSIVGWLAGSLFYLGPDWRYFQWRWSAFKMCPLFQYLEDTV